MSARAKGVSARPGRRRVWWPVLVGPAGLAALAAVAVVGAHRPGVRAVLDGPAQAWAEAISPYLAGVAVGISAVRCVVVRDRLTAVLTGLSVVLLLREIHFEWTHRGVYAMLAGVAVWAWVWRAPLRREAEGNAGRVRWLAGTIAAYALAWLISKRAFKFVPGEGRVHAFLEEWLEVVCHTMLVLLAAVGWWRRGGRQGSGGREEDPAAKGPGAG